MSRIMMPSRIFKREMKQFHSGSARARFCNYLFSSRWLKFYSVGMQQKRVAWSNWQKLRFWMKRNPCLWKSLQDLNITISISDLISVFDSHCSIPFLSPFLWDLSSSPTIHPIDTYFLWKFFKNDSKC